MPGYSREMHRESLDDTIETIEILGAKINKGKFMDRAGDVHVVQGEIRPEMTGRAYFGDRCVEGKYSNHDYMALPLIGKTLRYTTDVGKAGCGCNAAFYLASMRQNLQPSKCGDYYCDANSYCGVKCTEIDIQEANRFAWHSTPHTATDRSGLAKGCGGGGRDWVGPREWNKNQYGPGAACIDTYRPFEVAVSFYAGPAHWFWPRILGGPETLASMVVTLSQNGSSCPLSVTISDYDGNTSISAPFSGQAMSELYSALKAGMTPVIAYESGDSFLWLDGVGADGQGSCKRDYASACPREEDSVKFYGFSLESVKPNGRGISLFSLQSLSITAVAAVASSAVGFVGAYMAHRETRKVRLKSRPDQGSYNKILPRTVSR